MPNEIDRRIAEEVLGWEVFDYIPNVFSLPFYCTDGEITRTSGPFVWEPWSPSTNMNDAMEVVAHFGELNFIWTMQSELKNRWRVKLTRGPSEWFRGDSDEGLPLAICLAALRASAI